jgi:periodic tryptophan protein 2
VLKQQGHYFDVNCLTYSPDSQLLATGADDNKVKVKYELMEMFYVFGKL